MRTEPVRGDTEHHGNTLRRLAPRQERPPPFLASNLCDTRVGPGVTQRVASHGLPLDRLLTPQLDSRPWQIAAADHTSSRTSSTRGVVAARRIAVQLTAACCAWIAMLSFASAQAARAEVTQILLPTLPLGGFDPHTIPVTEFAADAHGLWWMDPETGVLMRTTTEDGVSTLVNSEGGIGLALAPNEGVLVETHREGALLRVSSAGEETFTPPATWGKELSEPGFALENQLTSAPDGTSWFGLETYPRRSGPPIIGELTPSGSFVKLTVSGMQAEDDSDYMIIGASDDALWVAGDSQGTWGLARVTGPEAATFYPLWSPVAMYGANLAPGPHGEVWYAGFSNREFNPPLVLSSLSPGGVLTEYTLPAWIDGVTSLAVGPEGTVWLLVDRTEYAGEESACRCVHDRTLVKFTPPASYTSYDLGNTQSHDGPPPIPNVISSGEAPRDTRTLASVVVGPEGDAYLSGVVFGESAPLREFIRVPPDTPEIQLLSAPAPQQQASSPPSSLPPPPPVSRVIHGIDIAAEQRALNALKARAQALDAASMALDLLKVTVAAAAVVDAPELTVELMQPSFTDMAAGFVSGEAGQILIDDPPDRHYRRIEHVHPAGFPTVKPGRVVSRRVAHAWNTLLRDEMLYADATRTMVRSMERVEGAAEAKDCTWLNRQNRLVRADAALATTAASREPGLYAALRRDLQGSPLATLNLSATQLAAEQTAIAAHGLPPAATTALGRLGVGSREIAHITEAIKTVPTQSANLLTTITQAPSGLQGEIAALKGLQVTASHVIRCATPRRHRHDHHRHRHRP